MKTASGLVFLTILGLLGIIIALAFAMLVSSRAAYAGQRTLQAPALAQLAAQEGVDHAIGVIRREFDNRKAIPTQLTDAWRTNFWPIDAMKVRFSSPPWDQKAPLGEAGSPEDVNGNDVQWESRLLDPYMDRHPRGSGYRERENAFMYGYILHSGNARWYEPGVLTSDPVARPISFHLPHPCPAQAASPDPARRAGENWSPDVNAPMWYDASFVATEDPAQRRYRLRYAVAVEDLGGHLLAAAPGAYDPAVRSAAATPPTVPTDADQTRAVEVDPVLSRRYAGAINNLARHTHPTSVGNYGELLDLAFSGLGTPMVSPPGSDAGTGLSGGRSRRLLGGLGPAGDLQRWQDYINATDPGEADRRPNARKSEGGVFDYFALGPIPSFHRMHLQQQTTDGNVCWLQLLFTPFGRIPETAAVPTAWNQGYVDTPWRINLPTAAPRALAQMVTAYMPTEFLARAYLRKKKSNWTGSTWDDAGCPDEFAPAGSPWMLELRHVRLFAEMAGEGYFSDRGGIFPGAPYPGSDLTNKPGWADNLGHKVFSHSETDLVVILWDKDCPTCDPNNNDLKDAAEVPPPFTCNHPGSGPGGWVPHSWVDRNGNGYWDATTFLDDAGIGLVGSDKTYTIPLKAYITDSVLKEEQNAAITDGARIELVDQTSFFTSYWQDMHASMMNALALAHWAWGDKLIGATSGTPGSGIPRWPPASAARFVPAGYFPIGDAPNFTVGGFARDRDVDGDGAPDVPSTFDTVREVDAQFLRNLGESPIEYATGTRPILPVDGIRIQKGSSWTPPAIEVVDMTPSATVQSATIKAIRLGGQTNEAGLMELVVNDMRMSFFGASPSYPDFRPLDLDDDGIVRCSCYPGGNVAAGSVAGAAMKRFSLTGYIDFQKSRFYRIFVRGEVFDEVRGVAIAQDSLETVYVVDPDGDVVDRNFVYSTVAARAAGTGMSDSHVLFQRWLRNRYQGLRSAVDQ
jgi:hypothetical protein